MPEIAVLLERKESVHKADEVVLESKKELLSSVDFSLEPIENKIAEGALAPASEIVKSEVSFEPATSVITEEVIPDTSINEINPDIMEFTNPELSYKGKLDILYCKGSTIDLDELEIISGENIIPINECVIEGIDTSVAGEHLVKITFGNYSVEVPYTVVDYKVILHGAGEDMTYSLENYRLDTSVIGIPAKLGKVFTGWYKDEACTIPFVSALPGEVMLDLYAGWSDFDQFVCDETGYIIGYTGDYGSIQDGLLNLTAHPSCIGVRADAFIDLEEFVTDIYIPANITHIENGAFDCIPYVFYFYVHPNNPVYASDNGILYTKDMSTVVAYPSGR